MDFALDLAVTIVSVVVVGFYAWSLRGHFSSPEMPDGTKIISAAVITTTLFFLFLIWFRAQSVELRIAGLAIEVASAALFWWAISASRNARLRYAFDPEGPRGLVTTGPYRYLRHPFYVSYLALWCGWALSTWTWVAFVPVAVIGAVYVKAAQDEEATIAASPLAGDYADYKRRAGFFWPRLGGSS